MQDSNVRPKAVELLKEIIGQKLHNIAFENDFLDMTPQATKIIEKLDFMKIKVFTLKDTIHRVKGQPTER